MTTLPSPSLQLYTLREAMKTDIAGTLSKVAEIGYTRVEPYDFVATADQLAAAFAVNGLTAPSGHAPLLRADQNEIFAAARRLGIGTVIDPATARDRWAERADVAAIATAVNEAARRGADHGIRVGYHNHWWELESRIDGRFSLEVFADLLDPAVVLEIDTYWAMVGGAEPIALLGRLGDRVRFIHVKDGPPSREPADQVAVGSGSLPIWDIIAAASLIEVGVVELDATRGDVLQAVADSWTYLAAGEPEAVG